MPDVDDGIDCRYCDDDGDDDDCAEIHWEPLLNNVVAYGTMMGPDDESVRPSVVANWKDLVADNS